MKTVDLRFDIKDKDREAVETITRASGFFDEHEVGIALEVYDDYVNVPNAGYEFVFAEYEGAVVGYASWGWDEQTVSSYEMYWIVVDPAMQSAGIGAQLLRAVESIVSKKAPCQLYIETAGRDQYLPTRKFYERQGYKQAAWLDDYFAPGDARVIFSKHF